MPAFPCVTEHNWPNRLLRDAGFFGFNAAADPGIALQDFAKAAEHLWTGDFREL